MTLITSIPGGPTISIFQSALPAGMLTVWPARTCVSRWWKLGKITATRPLVPTLSTVT